jgi:hypothetical protein
MFVPTEKKNQYGIQLLSCLDSAFGDRATIGKLIHLQIRDLRKYEKVEEEFADKCAELKDLSHKEMDLSGSFALQKDWWVVEPYEVRFAAPNGRIARSSYIESDYIDEAIENITKYLLFYPSVVIPFSKEALFHADLWAYDSLLDQSMQTDLCWDARRFFSLFAPFIKIRDLIENGIVVIIPPIPPDKVDELERRALEEADVVARAARSQPLFMDWEQLGQFLPSGQLKRLRASNRKTDGVYTNQIPQPSRSVILRELATGFLDHLTIVESLGANYLTDNEQDWQLLLARNRRLGQILNETDKIKLYTGTMIGKVALPRITNITPKDIVDLRKEDDCFNTWTLAVRSVLRHFVDKNLERIDFAREFREYAREVLTEPAIRLRNEVERKTSWKKKVSAGAYGFAVSGIGAVTAMSLGVNPKTALGGALSSGIAGFVAAVFANRLRRSERALLNHYSVLASTERPV